jgi:Spy/CpxP family protein refolding chaperone
LSADVGNVRKMGSTAGLARALVVAGLLVGGSAARAEPLPPARSAPPPAAPDHRSPDQLRKEVLERMRALRAWRLVEGLKLDEATSARLFPILARYDEREMAIAVERHDIMHELGPLTDAPHPDDMRITAAINRLLAVRAKQRALEDDRIKDLRKVLTPAQQAKLVMLLPRLEREFARWVHEVAGHPGRADDEP